MLIIIIYQNKPQKFFTIVIRPIGLVCLAPNCPCAELSDADCLAPNCSVTASWYAPAVSSYIQQPYTLPKNVIFPNCRFNLERGVGPKCYAGRSRPIFCVLCSCRFRRTSCSLSATAPVQNLS